jgi:hypothetical protein
MSATMIPCQEAHVFDPAMTAIMGEAYDLARHQFRASGVSEDAIALLIIEICKTSENDARCICGRTVMALEALEALVRQRPRW